MVPNSIRLFFLGGTIVLVLGTREASTGLGEEPNLRQAAEPSEVVSMTSHWEASSWRERILRQRSTRDLLELMANPDFVTQLEEWGRGLHTWKIRSRSGWRWEGKDSRGTRIILASEGPLLVAVRQGRTIEMSIRDRSKGTAVPRGYAGRARYFGHSSDSTRYVTAMSVEHFSRKSPELFKYFYYFAGPTPEIVSTGVLPRSPMDLLGR